MQKLFLVAAHIQLKETEGKWVQWRDQPQLDTILLLQHAIKSCTSFATRNKMPWLLHSFFNVQQIALTTLMMTILQKSLLAHLAGPLCFQKGEGMAHTWSRMQIQDRYRHSGSKQEWAWPLAFVWTSSKLVAVRDDFSSVLHKETVVGKAEVGRPISLSLHGIK